MAWGNQQTINEILVKELLIVNKKNLFYKFIKYILIYQINVGKVLLNAKNTSHLSYFSESTLTIAS